MQTVKPAPRGPMPLLVLSSLKQCTVEEGACAFAGEDAAEERELWIGFHALWNALIVILAMHGDV